MEPPLVMVIDDDPGFRKMFGTAAEEWGYRVVAIEDVETGLALLDRRQPDAIVLDVVMPKSHGIALLGPLEQRKAECAVIVITGYGEAYLDAAAKLVEQRGLKLAGAFTKPIELPELKAALLKAVPLP